MGCPYHVLYMRLTQNFGKGQRKCVKAISWGTDKKQYYVYMVGLLNWLVHETCSYLAKIKLVNILPWKRVMAHEPLFLIENLLTTDGFCEEGDYFL